ncbi:PepSY-associated TM helix domain-containing protein [Bordetella petrii]|uniref:PepSY-associated TM helix domain-containing protein n=1 Tax=Bordetella petrii TaxID=94624 RepID=UPI001E3E728D|nr:PepSY-associated TM helix domain-containing protein [Bordetella petrii]MCD0505663.1 PepSY domain-containing protein [Bordetella petrii]
MPALRSLWLRCHRWLALGMGGILIVSGLTGSLLVMARPLDKWLHPQLFVAAFPVSDAQVPLESLRLRLAEEFGPGAPLTFRPPRQPGETLQVLVRGPWRGTVYLDPASGMEQGRRGDNQGFAALLYGLHSSLWMQQLGKAVLTWAALAYLLLAVSGLVLWWPRRWPPSLRVELRKGLLRALFDMHRSGGALLALALALCIGSGAYLAWRPIGQWMTWLSGARPTAIPAAPAGRGPMLPLDELVRTAQATFPTGRVGYVLYKPQAGQALAVRMRLPGDPHPNGRSTVWLDPRSGAVLAAHRWNELDPGTRVNSIIYPLHTGELGGVPWQAGVALLGLALAGLGVSGIWLWWRRRAARHAAGRPRGRPPGAISSTK